MLGTSLRVVASVAAAIAGWPWRHSVGNRWLIASLPAIPALRAT
jgi:hypothetical protein